MQNNSGDYELRDEYDLSKMTIVAKGRYAPGRRIEKRCSLRYQIIFAPEAEEDLLALRADERAEVLDAIETHLRYEPEKTSKSRIKRLEGMEWPQYRLRIGDIRVFYDVFYESQGSYVEVLAIRAKNEAMQWLAEYGRRTE
jgi:mRNA-degrading endonuclease RelE of RelBE toxin-antitoxin system